MQLAMIKYSLSTRGPPDISETTRARMLKLKTQLDVTKNPLLDIKIFLLGGIQEVQGP